MQTLWDGLQQLIRIVLYIVSGWFVREGWIDENTATQLIGAGIAVATGVWTIWWNRREVVTVAGATVAAKDPATPVTDTTVSQLVAAKH